MSASTTKIKITDDDVRIFEALAKWRFCTGPQLARLMERSQDKTGRRLGKLARAGYIGRVRPLFGQPGIFFLMAKGAEFFPGGLPGRISAASVSHTLALVDVFLTLLERYPQAEIVSEHELRSEAGRAPGGVKNQGSGHFPDMILFLGGQEIAIEVELTGKSRQNRAKVYSRLVKGQHDQVWYLCRTRAIAQAVADDVYANAQYQGYIRAWCLADLDTEIIGQAPNGSETPLALAEECQEVEQQSAESKMQNLFARMEKEGY